MINLKKNFKLKKLHYASLNINICKNSACSKSPTFWHRKIKTVLKNRKIAIFKFKFNNHTNNQKQQYLEFGC